MSERERQQILAKARSEVARTMFELRKLKDHSSPSGWKQAAELIVELGEIRSKIEKLDS